MSQMRLVFALLLAALAGCASAPEAPPPPKGPLKVTVLALNDFHGNLMPPAGGVTTNATRRTPTPAGGAALLATALAEERARNPHNVFVAAGDLVGASPLLSALLNDEPTIEVMTQLGLEASAMGNHELDRGSAEILRLQRGGCHPQDGCRGPAPFKGAGFRYLAANTLVQASGQTLFPPYWIKHFEGVPVAFVGVILKGTPRVVSPKGVAGLAFRDEADSVNALVPELRRQGVEAIVVLMHEGGVTSGDINECPDLTGPVVDIVKRFDRAIDVVVSGHSHRAYNCRVDGRLVTAADRFGTLLTRIDLTIDRATRDVSASEAENIVLSPARFAPHPVVRAMLAGYERIVAPLAKRPVGRLTQALLQRANAAGESPIARVVVDSQLEATRDAGAQIAFINAGGVRAQLGREDRLEIVYEDLFSVQPFNNQLVTMSLSGAQIIQLLEQQWRASRARLMNVSTGFAYAWDDRRPLGQRVIPGSVTLNGQALEPQATYRVTVNAFMADGAEDLTVFAQGRERQYGVQDIEALELYLRARPVFTPDVAPRITRVGAPDAAR